MYCEYLHPSPECRVDIPTASPSIQICTHPRYLRVPVEPRADYRETPRRPNRERIILTILDRRSTKSKISCDPAQFRRSILRKDSDCILMDAIETLPEHMRRRIWVHIRKSSPNARILFAYENLNDILEPKGFLCKLVCL